jgi:type IV pilus assembly protein PilC
MEFSYKAKNLEGQLSAGVISASDEKHALEILGKQRLFVVEIKNNQAKQAFGQGLQFKKSVSLKDRIIFTNQLAIMIKAGLPLVEALQALKEQTENPVFIKAIAEITDEVRGGQALSIALSHHPKIFPELYIAVTASGEKSGKLDVDLERLSDQLQKDYDLITKVKGAITYPIVIVTALIGVVIMMLVYVVPKMKDIFDQMGVALPLPTRILLATSGFIINYWYIVIIVLAAIILGIRFWVRTPAGRLALDTFKIKMPLFGALTKKIYLARFARTTATLIASGLPMLEIISTDKAVVSNHYYQPIFDQIHHDVESGIPLSAALKKHKIFPAMISQMVSVGEKSGKIDQILSQLAGFYDKEVEASTSNMASLIEPILIIIIGFGMGVAIIAVIMPIYSLVNVI